MFAFRVQKVRRSEGVFQLRDSMSDLQELLVSPEMIEQMVPSCFIVLILFGNSVIGCCNTDFFGLGNVSAQDNVAYSSEKSTTLIPVYIRSLKLTRGSREILKT